MLRQYDARMDRRTTRTLGLLVTAGCLLASGCGHAWHRHAHHDRYDYEHHHDEPRVGFVEDSGTEITAVYATRTIPHHERRRHRSRGGSFFSFGFGYSSGPSYYNRHGHGRYGYGNSSRGYGDRGSRGYGCKPY